MSNEFLKFLVFTCSVAPCHFLPPMPPDRDDEGMGPSGIRHAPLPRIGHAAEMVENAVFLVMLIYLGVAQISLALVS